MKERTRRRGRRERWCGGLAGVSSIHRRGKKWKTGADRTTEGGRLEDGRGGVVEEIVDVAVSLGERTSCVACYDDLAVDDLGRCWRWHGCVVCGFGPLSLGVSYPHRGTWSEVPMEPMVHKASSRCEGCNSRCSVQGADKIPPGS